MKIKTLVITALLFTSSVASASEPVKTTEVLDNMQYTQEQITTMFNAMVMAISIEYLSNDDSGKSKYLAVIADRMAENCSDCLPYDEMMSYMQTEFTQQFPEFQLAIETHKIKVAEQQLEQNAADKAEAQKRIDELTAQSSTVE